MPIQPRLYSGSKGRRSSSAWKVVCIALICVLAVGLGTLSVYTVLTVGEQQRMAAEQAAALSTLQQELSQTQDELEQKRQELEQTQSDAASSIAEKDERIGQQDKTISDLNDRIQDLEKQVALRRQQQAQTQGQQPSASLPAVNTYPNQKIVALTFDDGPGPYTAQLLDILKERGVPATFFTLGTRVEAYPELIRRMEAEGHEVGNHSNSHKNLQNLSTVAQVEAEMNLCASRIEKLLGHRPTVMRCPYGAFDDAVKQYAKGEGIPIIQWDIDTRDWESRNATAVVKTTFASGGLGDGSIVLLHDIHKSTVEAVPQLIDRFKAQGYTFVTVTQLLQARCGGVEPGGVYYEG